MRPVDKGEKTDLDYSEYGDVKEELIKRIGAFCSFCELPIRHVPEVEHREAKSRGGSKLAWNNLLLSCKYCNCRDEFIKWQNPKSTVKHVRWR